MREKIIELAKKYDADLVGFAPASRFDPEDPVFRVFPETKTVIGLGFRVLRGIYRGVEEGTTYYQYTTMGVENLEETVMPLALINVSNLIEEEGFEAIPQRKNQLIMSDENGTNPEMDYTDVVRGVKAENQLDFLNCAVQCGLGERSMIGSLLTPEYGPFIRYCFILTDAELEPSGCAPQAFVTNAANASKPARAEPSAATAPWIPGGAACIITAHPAAKIPLCRRMPTRILRIDCRLLPVKRRSTWNWRKRSWALRIFTLRRSIFTGHPSADVPATEPATSTWRKRAC